MFKLHFKIFFPPEKFFDLICLIPFGHVHFAYEHFFGSVDLAFCSFIELEFQLRKVTGVDRAVRGS